MKNSGYAGFARFYDMFTDNVPYERWADFYERIFRRLARRPVKILDFACGTGTLSYILAGRGYEVIGADISQDMLTVAASKPFKGGKRPVFIRQSMEELALSPPADAVVCALDSVNYLKSKESLFRAFASAGKSLKPGGLFIFDVNTESKLEKLHLNSFIREKNGIFLAWQAQYAACRRRAKYFINIFVPAGGGRYLRLEELHIERAHSLSELDAALRAGGMRRVGLFGELELRPPIAGEGRIFVAAKKLKSVKTEKKHG